MVRCPIELLQSEFGRSEHVRDLLVDSFLAAQVGLDLRQRRRGSNQSGTEYSLHSCFSSEDAMLRGLPRSIHPIFGQHHSAGGRLHSLKSLSINGRMKVTRLTLRAVSSVIGFRVRRIANLLGLPVGFRLDLATDLRRGGHTFSVGAGKAIEVELHDFRRGGGLGVGDPSDPRKPDNQGRNGADGYYLQQTSAGTSLQD
jgi:hypothetical protein